MINSLFNYAFDQGIQVQYATMNSSSTPSVADTESKSIIINMNCENENQLPFIIAHEISHILTCDVNDAELCFSTLMDTKYEYKANVGAISLLIPYYASEFDEIEDLNVHEFMNMFVIPDNMYGACISEFKKYVGI